LIVELGPVGTNVQETRVNSDVSNVGGGVGGGIGGYVIS
jgi:hypothetical protein